MANELNCMICGCELGPSDRYCPECGTPTALAADNVDDTSVPDEIATQVVVSAPPQEDTPALDEYIQLGGKKSFWQKLDSKRRKFFIVGVSAAAIVLVVVGIFLVRDIMLYLQASGIDSEASVSSDTAHESGTGNEAGSIAGGGVLVSTDSGVLESRSTGIYLKKGTLASTGSMQRISTDQAVCLNYFEDDLYYIGVPATGRETAIEGSSIRMIPSAVKDGKDDLSSRVLYKVQDRAYISCLSVRNGQMFFLEHSGDSYKFMQLACDASGDPTVITSFTASNAWAFVESSTLYVIECTGSSWKVSARSLDKQESDFTVCAKGDGSLLAVCLHNGSLFYSLDSGSVGSHLFANDLKGGVREYSEITGPVRIAASGDIVVTVTKAGGLAWLDTVSGFAHDVSDALKDQFSNAVPTDLALGVVDTEIYVRGANDSFANIDLNVKSNS